VNLGRCPVRAGPSLFLPRASWLKSSGQVAHQACPARQARCLCENPLVHNPIFLKETRKEGESEGKEKSQGRPCSADSLEATGQAELSSRGS
jgi:hypothetical protein